MANTYPQFTGNDLLSIGGIQNSYSLIRHILIGSPYATIRPSSIRTIRSAICAISGL